MSRGGRGGGRGGRGGGRGGFGGSSMPPMGLTFADLAMMSKEASELFPPIDMPHLSDATADELRIVSYSRDLSKRFRQSPCYLREEAEEKKDIQRYSDRYLPSAEERPSLASLKPLMNASFFPKEIWDGERDPKTRRAQLKREKRKIDWDSADRPEGERDEEEDDEDDEDVDDIEEDEGEDDADYGENYFDNGEEEDDNLGGFGGGDEGGDTYD